MSQTPDGLKPEGEHPDATAMCPGSQGAKMTSEPWQFTNRVMQSQVGGPRDEHPETFSRILKREDTSDSVGGFRVLDNWTGHISILAIYVYYIYIYIYMTLI